MIRPFRIYDFNDYLHIVSEEELYEFLMATKPKDEKMAYEDFINYMLLDGRFAIIHNDIVVGYILLDINEYHKKGTLTYVIAKEYQNQNIATNAIMEIIEYCFNKRHLKKIEAKVQKQNIASWKVLEKCGFSREGLIRQEFFSKGNFLDMYHYGILSEEYKSQ